MTFISNDFDTRERVNIDIGIRCPLQCPKCSRQEIYKKNNLEIKQVIDRKNLTKGGYIEQFKT